MNDQVYNKICEIYFMEENRLREKVEELERLLVPSGFNSSLMVDYIKARAVKEYFSAFMLDVIQYLNVINKQSTIQN